MITFIICGSLYQWFFYL